MSPMRIPATVLLAALSLALSGCRREPEPRPPIATETPAAALTPLTSRHTDLAAPPASTESAAKAEGTLPPGHPPLDSAAPASPLADGPSISGSVQVAPAVQAQIEGGALFLIARNAKREIVAVRREPAEASAEPLKFPMRFQLSGANAMVQGTKFEGPLDVTARWSRSGDAMPSKGDIEGTARGVAVPATDVALTLTDVRK